MKTAESEYKGQGLEELARLIDANGTLVTLQPTPWWICFVPGLRREWWHPLAHHKHQHVYAMRPLDSGDWLLVESWKHRLHVPILKPSDAISFLQWAALGDTLRVREHVPGRAWQLRGWSNCAVLSALVLGRQSWAWTPHGLYRELLVEPETETMDVESFLRNLRSN